MTFGGQPDIYAYAMTTQLKRRFLRHAVVPPANDNGGGLAA